MKFLPERSVFRVEISWDELRAIQKLVGKTSHYDRKKLGLSEEESNLAHDVFADIENKIGEYEI